ncbi:hypothetical protein F383_20626 [Gossypium arboreum]|uniref:Uncharacterized protein n=1 Tax=Gossypium arboreum TaxID=29729 RepID=A0A0B0MPZ3_GOSAR|nr:hypothetical protein F383_20626 [Gossypium arboreum]
MLHDRVSPGVALQIKSVYPTAMAHGRVFGRVVQVSMYALFSHGLQQGRVRWSCKAHSLFIRACDL